MNNELAKAKDEQKNLQDEKDYLEFKDKDLNKDLVAYAKALDIRKDELIDQLKNQISILQETVATLSKTIERSTERLSHGSR